MKSAPKWQYDEMKPSGVDFTDIEEVAAYDLMHRKFRDYAKSSEEIIQRLVLARRASSSIWGRALAPSHFTLAESVAPSTQSIYPPQCLNTAGSRLSDRDYPISSSAMEVCSPMSMLGLFDIVFPSWEENIGTKIEEWIKAVETMADARMAQEAVIHIRDEFSTYDWIMEGIIKRCGFRIDAAEYGDGFQTNYICTRM